MINCGNEISELTCLFCKPTTSRWERRHVAADLVQEWQDKESKSHKKHMHSNKSESNIEHRTAAIPVIHAVDDQAGTITRAKQHKKKYSCTRKM